jgi:hypothetical protein
VEKWDEISARKKWSQWKKKMRFQLERSGENGMRSWFERSGEKGASFQLERSGVCGEKG